MSIRHLVFAAGPVTYFLDTVLDVLDRTVRRLTERPFCPMTALLEFKDEAAATTGVR
jgi:hypothetical protein